MASRKPIKNGNICKTLSSFIQRTFVSELITVRHRLISPSWFYTLQRARGWLTSFLRWRVVLCSLKLKQYALCIALFQPPCLAVNDRKRSGPRGLKRKKKRSTAQSRLTPTTPPPMEAHAELNTCASGPPVWLKPATDGFLICRHKFLQNNNSREKMDLHNISFLASY